MNASDVTRLEFEVVGTSNPLSINLSSIGKVVAIELEQFDWLPATNPNYHLMGIAVNGLKGRYNKFGNSIACLKTIPYINNTFHYDASTDSELITMQTQDSNLNIYFIVRNSDDSNTLNKTNVTFDNNYLLNFSVIVKK